MEASRLKQPKTTLLDLLMQLQAGTPASEPLLVTLVLDLINSRRVILSGTYRAAKLPLA